MAEEHVLQDDPSRRVVRIGDTVRRPVHPWTPAVHALLRHLEDVGFPYAPRVLGFDTEGREVLSFIEGESGPQSWAKVVDDAGLARMARLLRDLHEAVRGFQPPAGLTWYTGERALRTDELICHGDFGPWNVVWQGSEPVGIIDWDYAHPAPPVYDVAYSLEYVAPFRDDTECLRWLRYTEPPDRRRRLETFARAYGLSSADGLVDAVIDAQQNMIRRVHALADDGRQPQVDWVAQGRLDELAERVAWSRANRDLFE